MVFSPPGGPLYQHKNVFDWLVSNALKFSPLYITLREIVRIPSYSGPHFPAFGLNTERYSVSPHIQSKCWKMRTRVNPNTNTFYSLSDFFYYVYKALLCIKTFFETTLKIREYILYTNF